jgi:hypothetical protein
LRLFAENRINLKDLSRLKFLQIGVCVGLILGIVFSHELWFPIARTFPRVPLVFASPILIDQLLTVILIISLIFLVASFRPKALFSAAITSLILLTFFDQIRLQPWVYQYFLLLVILALQTDDKTRHTLCLSQIIIAGLYFWSGIQKLNYSFSHETLPILLTPIQNLFPTVELPFVAIGLIAAIFELLIGCGLVFRKTRSLAVLLTIATHAGILILLISKNYNSIVWVWNAILIVLVIVAFWKNDNSIKPLFIFANQPNWKVRLVTFIVLLSLFLPILSFAGCWNMYLSGALYSGNTAIAVIRINQGLYQNLSPSAERSVFYSPKIEAQILPLAEWSIADLNVPVAPEQVVFKKALREVCKLSPNENQIELIIKEPPAILDGSYKVTKTSCEQLER